jgi:hypothetical protein
MRQRVPPALGGAGLVQLGPPGGPILTPECRGNVPRWSVLV